MSDLARFRRGLRLPSRPASGGVRIEDPLRGILLIVPAMICFSASDTTSKFLTQSLPPIEIAWIRYATYAAMMLPALLRPGAGGISLAGMRTRQPALQALRGLGVVTSSILFIVGLQTLPMAVAAATSFCSPIFITILCIPMLGEKVGLRRWGAVVAGLLGVLVVVRPATSAFQPGVVFPVLSSVAWAFAMIFTRQMAGTDRVLTTMAWSGFTGLAALTVLLPFVWVPPSSGAILLAMFVGAVSTMAQLLVVMAYRHAPASVLAPFSYTQLLWSTSFGFLVFGAAPDRWTLVGAAIIAASGLYTAHRERVQGRARRAGG